MTDVNKIDIKEFRVFGYLHELNRKFLHPLGLALEVVIDDETGEERLGGVWDYRDDPEGICYGEDQLDEEKAERVRKEQASRIRIRKGILGYWIQPVK